MPYQLIEDPVSHDMVEALEQMLQAARSGEGLGLIAGMMIKRRRFFVICVGEAERDPTFARGMCAALDDEIKTHVHGRAGGETLF